MMIAIRQRQSRKLTRQKSQLLFPVLAFSSLDRRSENVRVKRGIIPELQLGDIERVILSPDSARCAATLHRHYCAGLVPMSTAANVTSADSSHPSPFRGTSA